MAIVTSTVTGRVLLPNDTAYTDGVLSFQLSETDVESEAVMPTGKLSVTLDGDDIPTGFALWRNTRGLRGTYYTVTMTATVNLELGGGQVLPTRKTFNLGTCQVGSSSTYTIGALLGSPVGDAADWARQVRYFETRAEFVTWAGSNDPYAGTVIFAAGVAYRFLDSGTAIVDLPGWVIQTSDTASIADDAVTNTKLANMAQATFKMRAAGAGTGDPIDGTAAQAKTALAITGADMTMSGGGTAQEYAGFSTRAAFVTWASGKTPAAGTVIPAGGYAYRYIGTGTAISDLAGWVPEGDAYPDHFATNTTPGTTNMATAINAALTYSFEVCLSDSTYFASASTANIITTAAGGNRIKGKGRTASVISGSGSNASSCFLLNMGGPLEIEDCTLTVLATGQANAQIIKVASGLRLRRVLFDGAVTFPGPNQVGYGLSWPSSGAQDGLDIEDCHFTRLHWPFQKANTATSTQNGLRIVNCEFYGNFREDIGINSPAGSMKNVVIANNRFRDHAGIAAGITDSCMNITLASVNVGSVSGNVFLGNVQQCIHIEENCRRLTVTGNSGECSFANNGGFVVLSSNNVGGSSLSPMDISITGNTAINTSAVSVSVGVWLYNNSFTGPPRMTGIVISDNVFADFVYGFILDNESDGGVKVAHNVARSCTYGFRVTASADMLEGNTSLDCDEGVRGTGATFKGHTFVNCTSIVYQDAGSAIGVTLIDPTFQFREFAAAPASTTQLVVTTMRSTDRMYGFLTVTVRTETTPHSSMSIREVTWAGATLTQASKFSYEPGTIAVALNVTSSNFRVAVFDAGVSLSNVAVTVNLNGAMMIQV